MVRQVMAIGVQAVVVSEDAVKVDGVRFVIPARYEIESLFVTRLGTDAVLFGAMSGHGQDTSVETLRRGVRTALEKYPVDGRDLSVRRDWCVVARRGTCADKLYRRRLSAPDRDSVPGGGGDVVEGVVVGAAVAAEVIGGVGQLSPFYSVLVHEEQEDGRVIPTVIPSRLWEPGDPRGHLDERSLSTAVRDMFESLTHEDLGSIAHVAIRGDAQTPHYYLDEVYPDTTVGAVFAEARLRRADFADQRVLA